MQQNDTITAIATPVGSGGIGIIRLSGPAACHIVAKFFKSKNFIPASLRSHRLYLGIIIDPLDGSDLDEALVSYMRAPHSYTGEDVVEINCHSGMVLIEKILRMTIEGGARLADAGEFTRRGFLNGRMDLTQAEAVIDVIEAKSELGLKIASRQLTGKLSQRIERLCDDLLNITARIEAAIDFPEDDILLDAPPALAAQLEAIQDAAASLIATFHDGCLYAGGVQTVITGKPNVGKSSILNALLGDERAIVTAIPGTTRDLIQETITIGGLPIHLIDTAGLDDSDHEIEQAGMERARSKIAQADIALLVLDASRPLDHADHAVAKLLADKNIIIAINKTDLPSAWEPGGLASLLPSASTVAVSAMHHTGIEQLRQAIAHVVGKHDGISPSDILIANARHRSALEKARAALGQAIAGLRCDRAPELVSIDLHTALDALGEITGRTTADDILGVIFSRFCIGK
jgi:tRNA modification GTPase